MTEWHTIRTDAERAQVLFADRLAAAAAVQTGVLPGREPGAERMGLPPAHGPLADYRATRTRLAGEAQALARLVADTLTGVVPGAAYLVLKWDPGFARYDLDRVLDERGAAVHVFTGTPGADLLPPLPDRHPLRAAWDGADPADPQVLAEAIRMIDADGGHFDLVPYRLPHPDAPAEEPCLLLAPGLRAALPEAPEVFPRLVRPYA